MERGYPRCSGTRPSPARDDGPWPLVHGEVPDEPATLASDAPKPSGLQPGIDPIHVVDVDPEPLELPVPEAVPDVPEPRLRLDERATQSLRRRRGEGVDGTRGRKRVLEQGVGVPIAAEHPVQHDDVSVRQPHLRTVANLEGRAVRNPPLDGQAPSLVDGLGRKLDPVRPGGAMPNGLDGQVADPAPDIEDGPVADAGRLLATARAGGLHITHIVETHVHNDYVSGALELRAATEAAIAGPARAGYAFPFEPLAEGDGLSLGTLRIVAAETPGHTPEHLSYLVYEGDADEPTAVFTGGSLIVGSAGRTDLLGPDATLELTRAQHRSLLRLSALPEETLVLPTHGAGSFCSSAPPGEERTSTIGRARASNPVLA